MIINHNIAALNTHRQMGSAQSAQMSSMEKLSSGLRINSAKDDAAGLSISEKMRGQIRGLEQSTRNAQDGISLMQTAEGALSETHDILQRMNELAVQSSNDTYTSGDRAELQQEVDQLAEEITRIANNTEFNTKTLMDGNFSAKFQIGANMDQNISVSITKMDAEGLKVNNVAYSGTAAVAETDANNLVKASGVTATNYAGPNGTVSFKLSNDFASTTTIAAGAVTDADGVANTGTASVVTGGTFAVAETITATYADAAVATANVTGTESAIVSNTDVTAYTGATATYTLTASGTGAFTATDGSASFTVVTTGNTNEFKLQDSGNNDIGVVFTTDGSEANLDTFDIEVTAAKPASLTVTGATGTETYTATVDPADSTKYNVTGTGTGASTFSLSTTNLTDADNFQFTTTSTTTYKGSVEVTNTNGSKEKVELNNFNPAGTDKVLTPNGLSVNLENSLSSANKGQTFSVEITGMTESVVAGGIRVDTQRDANAAIKTIQSAIESVSSERSKLGAVQNRLDHTINNLATSSQNLTAAESRIRDVDYAEAA